MECRCNLTLDLVLPNRTNQSLWPLACTSLKSSGRRRPGSLQLTRSSSATLLFLLALDKRFCNRHGPSSGPHEHEPSLPPTPESHEKRSETGSYGPRGK